jgi:uncharacterized protein (DUF1919 family)
LHFLHYKTQEDAEKKWNRRIKRINEKKLIFKFSDGYLATDIHIENFDALPYKNKICFTAKPYTNLKSIVYMDRFKNENNVDLEWKYDTKYINLHNLISTIK